MTSVEVQPLPIPAIPTVAAPVMAAVPSAQQLPSAMPTPAAQSPPVLSLADYQRLPVVKDFSAYSRHAQSVALLRGGVVRKQYPPRFGDVFENEVHKMRRLQQLGCPCATIVSRRFFSADFLHELLWRAY